MAKKIKFPLSMKNDVLVKDLNELRENFDLDKAVSYFLDGKLLRWLEARYYDTESDAIKNLNKDSADFKQQLCNIFDVDFSAFGNTDTDFDVVAEHNRKLSKLKQYTSDTTILDNVDAVAFNQEDLADLLDEGVHDIYLCDNSFAIPLRVENKRYVGIGKVEVFINSDEKVDFESKNIEFENVQFNEDYRKIVEKPSVIESENDRLFNKGCEAENNKDYMEAFEDYEKAAELGDNRAMFRISELYYRGHGLAKDYVKSFEWLKMAIDNGNSDAYTFYSMGWRYYYGQGTTQDYYQAFEWYKKAADGGHAKSTYIIGKMYEEGKGVNNDYLEAYKWYKKSADLNYAPAMNGISLLYEKGLGLTKDITKCMKWLEKAYDLWDL